MLLFVLGCDPASIDTDSEASTVESEAVESQPDESDAEESDPETPRVVVNELSASADWVELFSEEPVDLGEMSISDDWNKPERQALYGTVDGYYVVELTGFKLASGGEAVGIFLGDESLDWVVFPALESTQSYARVPDGAEDWVVLDVPTPDAENRVIEIVEVEAIASGAEWAYVDDGVGPAEGWTEPGFDDSAWSRGPSPLGYGDSHQATVVSYGSDSSNKHVVTWFRHSFEHAGEEVHEGQVGLVCDDGCLLRLNGAEVFRYGVPDGELTNETYANRTASGSGETAWNFEDLDPSLLIEGENVLSAEVRQVQGSSSDLTFDASVQLTLVR